MKIKTPKLPKMLKRAPSARKILEASIKDIENGQWVCGSWSEKCPKKPKGCAMGLVAMNTRVEETVRFSYDKEGNLYAHITPLGVSDSKWPDSAKQAAAALAATVKAPVKARRTMERGMTPSEIVRDADSINEGIVINYNDGGMFGTVVEHRRRTKAALAWFKRALASLDA